MGETIYKGDVALTQIVAEITRQRGIVFVPISEHSRVDLVAELNGLLKKIQVKSGRLRDGSIIVDLRSSWSNKSGSYSIKRDKDDYDILAVYCPQNNKCYFIDMEKIENVSSIQIRVDSVEKCNARLVKLWAHDLEEYGG